MNKNKTYYIGSGNFFGKCEASDKFHKEMLPLLSTLKIKETDIDKIANIVSEIYSLVNMKHLNIVKIIIDYEYYNIS